MEAYDFAPYADSKSIEEEYMKLRGDLQYTPIPSTWIPSPFVSQIHPRDVKQLKSCLIHTGHSHSDGGAPPGDVNNEIDRLLDTKYGMEIWKSWKRAYDLWNGYYIHGRVNKQWIGEKLLWLQEGQAGHEVFAENPTSDVDSGGGFLAIKDIPDFRKPEHMYPYAVGGVESGLNESFDDNLQNTIWRPRRMGEENLKDRLYIEIDRDIEQSRESQTSELNEDAYGFSGGYLGGYDCGIGPFPVLRRLTTYVAVEAQEFGDQHKYTRHYCWDGVTGTILNMPSCPIKPNQEQIIDQSQNPNAEHYSDEWQEPFPIDIRRCLKISAETVLEEMPKPSRVPIVNKRCDMKEFEHHRLELPAAARQPWAKGDEQLELRYSPSRYQPTYEGDRSRLIGFPLDASHWDYERENDRNQIYRYFIINDHGGTLIVNGIEVKRHMIAGPLPNFAVIQCGQGEVAFWWGVGGREHHASLDSSWGEAEAESEISNDNGDKGSNDNGDAGSNDNGDEGSNDNGYKTSNDGADESSNDREDEWKYFNKSAGELWREKILEEHQSWVDNHGAYSADFWRECIQAAQDPQSDASPSRPVLANQLEPDDQTFWRLILQSEKKKYLDNVLTNGHVMDASLQADSAEYAQGVLDDAGSESLSIQLAYSSTRQSEIEQEEDNRKAMIKMKVQELATKTERHLRDPTNRITRPSKKPRFKSHEIYEEFREAYIKYRLASKFEEDLGNSEGALGSYGTYDMADLKEYLNVDKLEFENFMEEREHRRPTNRFVSRLSRNLAMTPLRYERKRSPEEQTRNQAERRVNLKRRLSQPSDGPRHKKSRLDPTSPRSQSQSSDEDSELQAALALSMKQAEDKFRKDIEEAERISASEFQASRREAFISRAESAELTPDQYAVSLGFKSMADYLQKTDETRKQAGHGKTKGDAHPYRQFMGEDGLKVFRSLYQDALRRGLNRLSETLVKTEDEVVRDEKNSALSAEAWVLMQVDQITLEDMDTFPKEDTAETEGDRIKWRYLNALLHQAEEWEATMTQLELEDYLHPPPVQAASYDKTFKEI